MVGLCMKKYLTILSFVFGCVFTNFHSNAEILTFDCKNINNVKKREYIKYEIDTQKNTLILRWKIEGQVAQETVPNIIEVLGTMITYKLSGWDEVYRFDYGENIFTDYQIKPTNESSIRCIRDKTIIAKRIEPEVPEAP